MLKNLILPNEHLKKTQWCEILIWCYNYNIFKVIINCFWKEYVLHYNVYWYILLFLFKSIFIIVMNY